jgi:hypothetical protein
MISIRAAIAQMADGVRTSSGWRPICFEVVTVDGVNSGRLYLGQSRTRRAKAG